MIWNNYYFKQIGMKWCSPLFCNIFMAIIEDAELAFYNWPSMEPFPF